MKPRMVDPPEWKRDARDKVLWGLMRKAQGPGRTRTIVRTYLEQLLLASSRGEGLSRRDSDYLTHLLIEEPRDWLHPDRWVHASPGRARAQR